MNKNAEDNDERITDDLIVDTDGADESVIAEELACESVKKLREKLAKAVAEKQQYLDSWQRDKAEFLNARKRDKEASDQFVRFANENLIAELVPVLESFNMAMSNREAWEKVDKNWRAGVESIYGQIRKTLQEAGLKDIDPIGQKFDPMRDEAIGFEPVDDEKKDQVVVAVIQKGYELNGKAIRAPKVKLGECKK